MKKHLTRQEEFDILKIVIDKFLLLGIFLLGFGLYMIIDSTDFTMGLTVILGGTALLIILAIIFVKEYEFIKA
jgi:hypothetical protein